jgi:AbrB family looped-hinge helix DNA binding protein
MRVTSKGQVTIPIEIRERLGLLPETEVEFRVDGGAVRLVKVAAKRTRRGKTRGQALIDRLRGTTDKKLTTDQILALTRK